MPPLRCPPIDPEQEVTPATIDRDWAASLVGLCMMVAANFVPGCMGDEEYIAGKIVRVDVDDDISASCIFRLELDDSIRTFHRMRYNAMLRYADEQHDNVFLFKNILTFVEIEAS